VRGERALAHQSVKEAKLGSTLFTHKLPDIQYTRNLLTVHKVALWAVCSAKPLIRQSVSFYSQIQVYNQGIIPGARQFECALSDRVSKTGGN